MSQSKDENIPVEEIWRDYLNKGTLPEWIHSPWFATKRLRPLFRRLPSDPRCKFCYYPFDGMGGKLVRSLLGIEPSRLNPQLCNLCEKFAAEHAGGAEIELTLLFADVRGSTRLAERMKPAEFSRLINRFYRTATTELFRVGGLVEKLIGDEVTAFFTTGFAGENHARVAVEAGLSILRATGHGDPSGPWIPVGVGVHTGVAYVGAVTTEGGKSDIAVLGDTANTAARLASLAGAGQVVLSEVTRAASGLEEAGMESRQLQLKGRREPVAAWILSAAAERAAVP
jgi:adenylate cyclase